jgi:hypothetical protein
MAEEKVSIKITGDPAQFLTAMATVGAEVSSFSKNFDTNINLVNSYFDKMAARSGQAARDSSKEWTAFAELLGLTGKVLREDFQSAFNQIASKGQVAAVVLRDTFKQAAMAMGHEAEAVDRAWTSTFNHLTTKSREMASAHITEFRKIQAELSQANVRNLAAYSSVSGKNATTSGQVFINAGLTQFEAQLGRVRHDVVSTQRVVNDSILKMTRGVGVPSASSSALVEYYREVDRNLKVQFSSIQKEIDKLHSLPSRGGNTPLPTAQTSMFGGSGSAGLSSAHHAALSTFAHSMPFGMGRTLGFAAMNFGAMTAGATNAGGAVASLASAIAKIPIPVIIGAALAMQAFSKAIDLAKAAASMLGRQVIEGFKYLDTIENARLGIAGLIFQMTDLVSAGKVLTDENERWNASLEISERLTKQLQYAALKTRAIFSELARGMQEGFGPMLQAGVREDNVTPFVTRFIHLMSTLRIPLREIGQEMRAFFNLESNPRTARASFIMLGLAVKQFGTDLDGAKEKLRQFRAEGRLDAWFMENTKGVEIAGLAGMKTLSGYISNLKEAWERGLGEGTEKHFPALMEAIEKAFNMLVKLDEQGNATFNPVLIETIDKTAAAFTRVGTTILDIIEKITDPDDGLISVTKEWLAALEQSKTGKANEAVLSAAEWLHQNAVKPFTQYMGQRTAELWQQTPGSKFFQPGASAPAVAPTDSMGLHKQLADIRRDQDAITAAQAGVNAALTSGIKKDIESAEKLAAFAVANAAANAAKRTYDKLVVEANIATRNQTPYDSAAVIKAKESWEAAKKLAAELNPQFTYDPRNTEPVDPEAEAKLKQWQRNYEKAIDFVKGKSQEFFKSFRDSQLEILLSTGEIKKWEYDYQAGLNKIADAEAAYTEEHKKHAEFLKGADLERHNANFAALMKNLGLQKTLLELEKQRVRLAESQKVYDAAAQSDYDFEKAWKDAAAKRNLTGDYNKDRKDEIEAAKEMWKEMGVAYMRSAQMAGDVFNTIAREGAKGFGKVAANTFNRLTQEGADNIGAILAGWLTNRKSEEDFLKMNPEQQKAYKATQDAKQANLQTAFGLGSIGLGSYAQARANQPGSITSGVISGAMSGASLGKGVMSAYLAVVGAIIGGIAAAMGKAAARDEYKYAQVAIDAYGQARLVKTKNLQPAEAEEMQARVQEQFDKFWNGYMKLAVQYGGDFIPKILDQARTIIIQKEASKNFLKHFDELVNGIIPDNIMDVFKPTLQSISVSLGMSANKFNEIFKKFDNLSPEKTLELFGVLFEALQKINQAALIYDNNDFLGGNTQFNMMVGQAQLDSRKSYAEQFAEERDELRRLAEMVKNLTGEAQIRALGEFGDSLSNMMQKHKQLAQEIANYLQNMMRTFAETRRTMQREGLGSFENDELGNKVWKPDVQAQADFTKAYLDVATRGIENSSNLQELQYWEAEWWKTFNELAAIYRQAGPEAYESFRIWSIGADGQSGILKTVQNAIEQRVGAWGVELAEKTNALMADLKPAVDLFKESVTGTNNAIRDFEGGLRGALEPINRFADALDGLSDRIDGLEFGGGGASPLSSVQADGQTFGDKVVGNRIARIITKAS